MPFVVVVLITDSYPLLMSGHFISVVCLHFSFLSCLSVWATKCSAIAVLAVLKQAHLDSAVQVFTAHHITVPMIANCWGLS